MKLKLSLTKGEYGALIGMAQVFVRHHFTSDDFTNYSYATALGLFLIKQGQRSLTKWLKEKNSVTLSDMETLAFYHIMRALSQSDKLQPYEDALVRNVLEAIGRQHDRERMRWMGRLSEPCCVALRVVARNDARNDSPQ
jgi:hypothetical protein